MGPQLIIGNRRFHVVRPPLLFSPVAVGISGCRNNNNTGQVNAALILVKLVWEYLNCLDMMPALHTDILQKIVELLR